MRIRPEICAFSTKSTGADANRLELAGAKFLSYRVAPGRLRATMAGKVAQRVGAASAADHRDVIATDYPLHRAQRLLMGRAREETPPKRRLAGSPSAGFPRTLN
jgi:hypothetical protein